MSSTSSTPPEPPVPAASDAARQRRRRLALIVGVSLLALVAVFLVVRALMPTPDPQATSASPSPSPSASVSARATPAPTPTSSAGTSAATPAATGTPQPGTPVPTSTAAVPPVVPRPTECEQLYSAAMMANFSELALNPAWTQEPGADAPAGSDDAELRALIDANEHLTCIWASPVGASGTGLTTDVVWVSAEESAAVQSRLGALGMDCFAESAGLRCVMTTTGDSEASGESHFLRDGVWLATKWSNIAPVGYTADIVSQLWPEG